MQSHPFPPRRAALATALAASLGLAAGLSGTAARAQDGYPNHPILVVVPLQSGSAADVATRIVIGKMADNMKASFLIENQPGASGLIGAEKVVRAAPDGYTLGGITDSVLNYAVNLSEHVNFDPVNDFQSISQMANISWVLVSNKDFPAKTVPELIAKARAEPGKIDYASGGNGSPQHISMALFAAANKIQLTHVPYKGATQATTDVSGGQVPMMFSAVSVVLPFIKDGKLHALAQPNLQRSPLLPDVPTFAEAGAPAFQFSTWLGLYGPKGLPKPLVDRLNAEVAKAVADPDVRQRLQQLGLDPVASQPAQLHELTKNGYARVGKAIKDAGIKAQ